MEQPTDLIDLRIAAADREQPTWEPQLQPEARRAFRARRLAEASALLTIVGLGVYAHAHGMTVHPAPVNDDEGTYVAQAWAVMTGLGPHHGPAQYTYWYDHPPLGWIQLAIVSWLVHLSGPGRLMTTLAARKIMLIYFTIDAFALYYILRRLGAGIILSLGALALFSLSPLSIYYLRQVFLDNIGLTWLLLSIAVLVSRRTWLFRATIGGILLGIAVLSKETLALFLPSAILYIAVNTKGAVRRFSMALFLGSSGIVVSFYLLFAALRGEFLPGLHHTSLIGAIEWQLFQRAAGGSIFTPGTIAAKFISVWWGLDPYFLLAILVLSVPCLFRRSTSFIGVMNLFGAAMLFRPGGYVPAMFIIAYIGTGAIAVGLGSRIIVDLMIPPLASLASRAQAWHRGNLVIDLTGPEPEISTPGKRAKTLTADDLPRRARRTRAIISALLAAIFVATASILAYPRYTAADAHLMDVSPSGDRWLPMLQAERWISTHIPRTSVLITDDYMWLDMVDEGFAPTHVVWVWKYGPDPEVVHRYPDPAKDIGYIISTSMVRITLQLPSEIYNQADQRSIQHSISKPAYVAFEHSKPVMRFGSGYFRVTIRKVVPGPPVCTTQCLSYALR